MKSFVEFQKEMQSGNNIFYKEVHEIFSKIYDPSKDASLFMDLIKHYFKGEVVTVVSG
jgi:hypothetical protein